MHVDFLTGMNTIKKENCYEKFNQENRSICYGVGLHGEHGFSGIGGLEPQRR
jgi:hypothetical protein